MNMSRFRQMRHVCGFVGNWQGIQVHGFVLLYLRSVLSCAHEAEWFRESHKKHDIFFTSAEIMFKVVLNIVRIVICARKRKQVTWEWGKAWPLWWVSLARDVTPSSFLYLLRNTETDMVSWKFVHPFNHPAAHSLQATLNFHAQGPGCTPEQSIGHLFCLLKRLPPAIEVGKYHVRYNYSRYAPPLMVQAQPWANRIPGQHMRQIWVFLHEILRFWEGYLISECVWAKPAEWKQKVTRENNNNSASSLCAISRILLVSRLRLRSKPSGFWQDLISAGVRRV